MLTTGRLRLTGREPGAAVRLLVLMGAVAVATLLAACGGGSGTTTPTKSTPVVHKPPNQAGDNFVWPFYGYDAARTRDFPSRLGPPLRKGWSYQDYALLEFPPVLYHDSMFFIDYDGSAKAVNKLNGHLIWQRELGTLSAVSPAVDPHHGLVFVPLLSETPGAKLPGNGKFFALSMRTGRSVWSKSLSAGSESSPLVHGSSVYFGDAGGTVYSLNTANGRVNWTFHAGGAVKGGVAYSAGDIYFGDYSGHVYALSASTGHEMWSASPGGTIYGSPALAFGKVFVGDTNHSVYALSKSSGRMLWSTATSAYVYSSPAAANVPGLGPTIYVGSYDGNFYALNATSGAIRWSHASGSKISGSGTVIGNVVYYGVLGVKNTIGLNIRTGRQVFSYPDGEFASAVADQQAIYLIGYSVIYQLLPTRR